MVRYFVMGENTLGYVDDRQPNVFGVLHASVLRGSTLDRLAGFTCISQPLRPATLEDFDAYRVSPRGHLQ
jgi:hypothetical protein